MVVCALSSASSYTLPFRPGQQACICPTQQSSAPSARLFWASKCCRRTAVLLGGIAGAVSGITGIGKTETFPCNLTIGDVGDLIGIAASDLSNQIYYCGGFSITDSVLSNKCYKNDDGNWTDASSMNVARSYFTMNNVGSSFIAIGGITTTGISNKIELFNSITNTWTEPPFLQSSTRIPRIGHCTVTLDDTTFVTIGGYPLDLSSTESSPATTIPPIIITNPPLGTDANTIPSLIIDGSNTPGRNVAQFVVEQYNLSNSLIETKTTIFPDDFNFSFIAGHACSLFQGEIYVSGGVGDVDHNAAKVYALNIQTFKWRKIPDLKFSRIGHTMEVVNGQLMVFGGFDLNRFCQDAPATLASTITTTNSSSIFNQLIIELTNTCNLLEDEQIKEVIDSFVTFITLNYTQLLEYLRLYLNQGYQDELTNLLTQFVLSSLERFKVKEWKTENLAGSYVGHASAVMFCQ